MAGTDTAGDTVGEPAQTGRQVNRPGAGGVVCAVQDGDQYVYVYGGDPPYWVSLFPLAPLPPSPGRVARAPSRLLAARHQVVAFTGRLAELDRLAGWRDDRAEVSVRLVHGPGGQGKTRLAARFAHESAAAGWTVAAATHGSDPSAQVAARRAGGPAQLQVAGQGLLLVVDYAERWPTQDLLRLVADHLGAGGGRVRVLLAARPAGSWWTGLAYQLDKAGIDDVDDLALPGLAEDPAGRAGIFTAAVTAFAPYLQVADPDRVPVPARLEHDPAYASVLTVHMAALAAVDAHRRGQAPPVDAAAVSRYLLDRERDHWDTLHTTGRVTTGPLQLGRAVYVAALTRALPHDPAVTALARARVASTPETASQVLADHALAYPPTTPGTCLQPLYPDRLAEDFLALTTPGHPCDHGQAADPWAATAVTHLLTGDQPTGTDTGTGADTGPGRPLPDYTRAALTMLIEAAARWPHLAERVLYPLLTDRPGLAPAAGGAALTRLAGLPGIDPDLLAAIQAHLPDGRHVDLDPAAAAITARLYPHRLATATDDAERARLHAQLGYRLANTGQREEALAAIGEAVEIYRRLAATRPDAFEPDLAMALNNLGARLSGLGRREDALTATGEAVEIYRRLAATRPDAFEPDLAGSLNNLGGMLSGLGRREDALTATNRAVEIYRRLATAHPDTFEPDLARALNNLGNQLSDLGRREDALTATSQAVEIRRRLAATRPDAFEPDLAAALNNLGARLSGLGRREDALTATSQAVEIYRRLAATRPDAFEPDLAAALNNLGMMLSGLGRREDALTATSQAVEIYRRLAAAHPDAFEPDLARSLWTEAWVRVAVGSDLPGALGAVEEAVARYERLYAVVPAAFAGDLAGALSTLADVFEGLDRGADAADARDRASKVDPG
jgi:tetratricopeptide (TPR) repeat protein